MIEKLKRLRSILNECDKVCLSDDDPLCTPRQPTLAPGNAGLLVISMYFDDITH